MAGPPRTLNCNLASLDLSKVVHFLDPFLTSILELIDGSVVWKSRGPQLRESRWQGGVAGVAIKALQSDPDLGSDQPLIYPDNPKCLVHCLVHSKCLSLLAVISSICCVLVNSAS